ncbi:MAG: YdcH family protein [Roseovarius sp.]
MSLSSHLDELKRKHQILSDQVEEEQRAPGSSDFTIADLKKQKLRLKEEIERLSTVDA